MTIQTLEQEKERFNGTLQEKLCLLENIRNENKQLVSELDSVNDKNRGLIDEIGHLTQQVDNKSKLLEEQSKELNFTNRIIGDIKKELVEGDANHKVDLKDHAKIYVLLLAKQKHLAQQKLETKCKKLKRKLMKLKTNASSQNLKFKELKKKMTADDDTIETLRINYHDAVEKLKKKQKDVGENKEALTNYAQMEVKVNTYDTNFKNLLDEKSKLLGEKDKEIEDLKQEKELSEERNKTLIEEYQAEISNIKKLLSKGGLPPPPPSTSPPPPQPPDSEHPPTVPQTGGGPPPCPRADSAVEENRQNAGRKQCVRQTLWKRKNEGYIICPKCTNKVKHVNIFRHLTQVHEISDLSLPCLECNDVAISQFNISNHISWLHETQTYPCNKCGHRFISFLFLKQHEKIVHRSYQ